MTVDGYLIDDEDDGCKISYSEISRLEKNRVDELMNCSYQALLMAIKEKLLQGGDSAYWFADAFLGFYFDIPVKIKGYRGLGAYDRLLFRRVLEIDKCEGFSYTCSDLHELAVWAREAWENRLSAKA